MDEYLQQILMEKAREIRIYLAADGLVGVYHIINYGINLEIRHDGKKHVLMIAYSPKKQQWSARSDSNWVKTAIIPKIGPLLGNERSQVQHSKQVAEQITNVLLETPFFAEANKCLLRLEPFADENIDCSIIYECTKRGLWLVLNDSQYAHLDRSTLEELLEYPVQPDFFTAKEYLLQCQTLCYIPTEN